MIGTSLIASGPGADDDRDLQLGFGSYMPLISAYRSRPLDSGLGLPA